MADPLSISASIIAVLQLTGSVIGYLNEVSEASRDRQHLLIEVSNARGILMTLGDLAQRMEHTDASTLTLRSLGVPDGPLEQFKKALERLASKLVPVKGWRNAGRALAWPFQKEEMKEILNTIERQKTLFSLALQNDHMGLSRAIQESIESTRNEIRYIAEGVSELHISSKDQRTQSILAWLSPLEFHSQQTDFNSRQQEGTGMWLIESDEFRNWQIGTRETLFCPGIPGAGKTILASIVIDHLLNTFLGESIGVAYLFCNYRSRLEQTPINMFASLLNQLLQRRAWIPDDLQQIYDDPKRKRTRPTLEEISRLLRSEISRFNQTFIIIDALDEYNDEDGVRRKFLSNLFELQNYGNMNLLVTSRFIPQIEQHFEKATKLEIQASPGDIQRYIKGQIHRLAVEASKDLEETIVNEIIQVVDGMFLLAQLHLDSLTDKTSSKGIRVALKRLPTGSDALDVAYNEAMKRIENQKPGFKSLAERTLSWITYAQRPLSVHELQHALAIEPDESEWDEENLSDIQLIVSVCAGLVTVDQESESVRLVHYTTQDYFERIRLKRFPDAQKNIATSCLTYLTYKVFQDGPCQSDATFERRLQEFKFLDYAARHWGDHVRGDTEQTVEELALKFLQDEDKTACSGQAMLASTYRYNKYSQNSIVNASGVHYCAYFGLKYIAARLFENQIAADLKDRRGQTPLFWAAENGHEAVVRLLAERDDVDADSRDTLHGQTPLSWAAGNGHEAVVRLLAERDDVDADSRDTLHGQTPLSWAARNGHEAVVRLLAERDDVDADSRDTLHGQTPLSWAARNGHEAVVRLLAERDDVDADSRDTLHRQTPLSWAAEHGHEAVVRLLAERDDVDADSKDGGGETPLFWAAINGHEAVARLLAERDDVDADSRDTLYGQTPLSRAAENGHEAVVRLLAERDDVDADSRDTLHGQTPLSWAARNGHEAVVRLLAERDDVDADSRDTLHRQTPLSWAAENGHEAVVRLLAERDDVDADSRDGDGQTPLSWAAGNGHETVVRLLKPHIITH